MKELIAVITELKANIKTLEIAKDNVGNIGDAEGLYQKRDGYQMSINLLKARLEYYENILKIKEGVK